MSIRIENNGVAATITADDDDAPVLELDTTDVRSGRWALAGHNSVERRQTGPLEDDIVESPEPRDVRVAVTGRVPGDEWEKLHELVSGYDTIAYDGAGLSFTFTPTDDSPFFTNFLSGLKEFKILQADDETIDVPRERRGDSVADKQ